MDSFWFGYFHATPVGWWSPYIEFRLCKISMDSLTQVVLGSAVGYAVLGNQVGRKVAIYGAILGTLPDLNVFLPYGGEVEAFTYHRGFGYNKKTAQTGAVTLIQRFDDEHPVHHLSGNLGLSKFFPDEVE